MPCVALSYRKLYRAPLISLCDALKSARLARAERLAAKSVAKIAKKSERASIKSAKKTARVAKTAAVTPEIAAAFVAPVSILTSTLLKDGDCVQIRPFRPRSTAKLSRLAVWKSSRALKKLVRSQIKSRRAARIKAQNDLRRAAKIEAQNEARRAAMAKQQIKSQSAESLNPQPKSCPISQPNPAPIAPKPQPQSQPIKIPAPQPTAPTIAPMPAPQPIKTLAPQPALNAKIPEPKPEPLTQSVVEKSPRPYRPARADLINAESRLGSTIFGPIPAGRRREFFHDRNNIWIWHESWLDAAAAPRELTVRYEVRPSGVYKKLAAGKYFKLEGAELENFRRAARTYLRLIKQHLYHLA